MHPGAETHTHTEAPTVASNWTDSLAIDLLQVSLGSVFTIPKLLLPDRIFHSFNLALLYFFHKMFFLIPWDTSCPFFFLSAVRFSSLLREVTQGLSQQEQISHGSSDLNTHWEHRVAFQEQQSHWNFSQISDHNTMSPCTQWETPLLREIDFLACLRVKKTTSKPLKWNNGSKWVIFQTQLNHYCHIWCSAYLKTWKKEET